MPLLELVRLRLSDLIQHIEKSRKTVVYSDFTDEIGPGIDHDLPQVELRISRVSSRRHATSCASMRTTSSCTRCVKGAR